LSEGAHHVLTALEAMFPGLPDHADKQRPPREHGASPYDALENEVLDGLMHTGGLLRGMNQQQVHEAVLGPPWDEPHGSTAVQAAWDQSASAWSTEAVGSLVLSNADPFEAPKAQAMDEQWHSDVQFTAVGMCGPSAPVGQRLQQRFQQQQPNGQQHDHQ
ncbi:unnamed protein product, partial [Closterium sp. Naga37s-1]